MKLSPLDIKRQQFGKAFRGYEPDEVDAFVKQVASQWESVLDELRLATERNRELEQKLKHYERVELALQEALETARETARRSEEAAERKAKIIVEQAELKADRTLQDVEQERFGLRRDIAKLTGRQNEVAARLRAFLMSELEILAQFQGDDPVGFIRLESSTQRTESVPEQLQAHEPTALSTGDSSDVAADIAPPADLTPAPDTEPEIERIDEASGLATDSPAPDPVAETKSETEPPAPLTAAPIGIGETTHTESAVEDKTETTEVQHDPIDWDLPQTVEPDIQAGAGSDWNLRTLVTGENESVAGSEAERERIRRILEDLD
ncbi:MAG: hypothetical protein Rubg2KO_05940 [Rubricoccaceae bacterium]